jgi:hypothetical protein
MLIQVIYKNDKRCGAVHRSRLDFLIRSGLLFAFRRENEWVIVEKDPVRGMGGNYAGPERRNSAAFVDNTNHGYSDDEEQAKTTCSSQDISESECMKVLETFRTR